MSLPGCEWESIERYEKLCGVVSRYEKSKAHFLHCVPGDAGEGGERVGVSLNCLRRMLYIAVHVELHSWPKLTKDNVQRSYLNFKEDE